MIDIDDKEKFIHWEVSIKDKDGISKTYKEFMPYSFRMMIFYLKSHYSLEDKRVTLIYRDYVPCWGELISVKVLDDEKISEYDLDVLNYILGSAKWRINEKLISEGLDWNNLEYNCLGEVK